MKRPTENLINEPGNPVRDMKQPRPTAPRAGRHPHPDQDDTVVLPRSPAPAGPGVWPASNPRHVGRRAWLAAGGVVCAGCLLGAGYFVTRGSGPRVASAPQPAAPPRVAAAPPAAPAPQPPATPVEFAIRTATQNQILHNPTAPGVTIFRFSHDTRVLVLDFATMEQQGQMLDRVAALIEKAGTPRDRVLTEPELLAAIHQGGDTVATYYYGHDYSAESLRRFFTLAAAGKIALDAEEERLRRLLHQEGWFAPGLRRGLISIPAVGAHPDITLSARYAILHHELSHGVFFSDADYAAHVHRFWFSTLNGQERTAVRRFLGSEGYDMTYEELMYNEMQAYLMFTQDPAFFRPDLVGMTPQHLAALQGEFLHGMPRGWLRDALATTLHAARPAARGKILAHAAPT